MKIEPTSVKQQTEKQSKARMHCLWWKYDDDTFGSIYFDKGSRECTDFKCYGNRAALNGQLRYCKDKGLKTEKLKFDVGLEKSMDNQRFKSHFYTESEYLQEGFHELQKMLSSYEKDGSQFEILSLLSLILSGYLARMLLRDQENPSIYFSRAPIVRVRKHSKDLCGGFEHLQRITQSLAVDTARFANLVPFNPSVIPYVKRVKDIDSHAYAKYQKDINKYHVPTMYRDTAVLIHCSFFKDKPVQDFVERNRWCTALLFNMKKANWPCLFAEVNMDNMGLQEWKWDPKPVYDLIDQFVFWLETKRTHKSTLMFWTNFWREVAENIIYRYNLATVSTGQRIKQGSEWDLACLQVAAITAFLSFLYTNEVLDRDAHDKWFIDWVNILLPGSCTQETFPKASEPVHKMQEKSMQSFPRIFERLIQEIIAYDGGSKLCADIRSCTDKEDLDLEQDPWAFLDVMQQSKADPKIPVIKIRYEELRKLSKKLGYHQAEWSRQSLIQKALEKEQTEHGGLDYIHSMKVIRLVLGSKSSHTGMTLKINEMDFINEETRQKLISRISSVK